MMSNRNSMRLTAEEYLELEQTSPVKHEYRDGQVYAMSGVDNNQVLIAVNLVTLLRNRVRGKGSRVYTSDTKVHLEKPDIYYYPDVTVSCDQRDRLFTNFIRYPCVIVEVLSDATEAFDRGDKFDDYQHIETLQEYVLVSQTRKRVDRFQRNTKGQWLLSSFREKDKLQLNSIGFSCGVAELYEEVDFSAPAQPSQLNK